MRGEGTSNLQGEEEEEWKPRLVLPHTCCLSNWTPGTLL